MTSQSESEILLLREKGLTPKEIARKLSLKPSQVNTIIKSSATQTAIAKAESGELATIVKNTIKSNIGNKFFIFEKVTQPIPTQQRAIDLLGITMICTQ